RTIVAEGRRQRSGRLERLLNRSATQIVLWVCDPSVFVGFAEQILDIYSVQSSLPVKLDRLRVYELEKLILVVYAVGDSGPRIPLVGSHPKHFCIPIQSTWSGHDEIVLIEVYHLGYTELA